jgi:hypothetical protein
MAGTIADRRITRALSYFNENRNGKTINEYFEIKSPIFELVRDDYTTFTFTSKDNESYDVSMIKLPEDIQRLITTYINKYADITYTINYGLDYPFKPPKWIIKHIHTNLKIQSDIELITRQHNNSYMIDWTPYIYIEKDTLYMIEKIKRLEYFKSL